MNRELLAQTFVTAAKHSPLSRGRGRRTILKVLQKIHPEPLPSTFRGVPFLFHLDNTTERKALVSDSYDRVELDFLIGFLNSSPSTFIDIGANSGLYSLYLASRMPPGSRVYAVEPNPEMCRRVAANAALLREKGLAADVAIELRQLAIGAASGVAYLDLSLGLGPAFLADQKGESTLSVNVMTLIGFCRENSIGSIGAIKIDVEGYEDRVLLPFLSAAPTELLPRALIFETVHRNHWERDAVAACLEAGYAITRKTRSSILMALKS